MRAFVTVGSTRFDTLVACVFTPSVLSSLRDKGYKEIVIQCGNSNFELAGLLNESDRFSSESCGIQIECWRYKPTLSEEFEQADLVISHAGSGTILDVLRLGKPLIVVPNSTLLDNHQQELAAALEEMNHLRISRISDLAKTIEQFDPQSLASFPPFDGSKFRDILDEEMGFS
ncbi:N-acetylglucosaminyldiphosphodolichol N-acetylglucosaminyltransferase catalytic subunit alg13 [Marasmius tenuissimus]|nr:N-acetylglucosaminyldiphosphodolichol N-acetylglucosaminyltransferase catalytic subunit alg13 [Marasmius tenuissimus]